MKTVHDLKMKFKQETGIYADADSRAYREWLESEILELINNRPPLSPELLWTTSEWDMV